jgi:hypothetical protein
VLLAARSTQALSKKESQNMTKHKGLLILFGGMFALVLVVAGTAAIAQAIDLQDIPNEDTAPLLYQGEGDADSPDQDGEGAPGHHGFGEGDADSHGHHGFGEDDADSHGHHGFGEGDADSPGYHGYGKGKRGFHEQLEGVTPMDELLAAELGISVEALHDGMAEAHAAAMEQGDFPRDHSGHHGGHHGGHDGLGEEYLALLAEKLGKSVEDLQAAQVAANAAFLAELVDAGVVTQEQIDMMEARRALSETINREALMAEALGIDLAEFEAAQEAGTSLRELLGDTSVEDFAAAVMAAYEAAVLQAAADGVITDAQADEILNGGFGQGRSFGHGFGFGQGRGFGGPGGSRGFGPMQRGMAATGVNL